MKRLWMMLVTVFLTALSACVQPPEATIAQASPAHITVMTSGGFAEAFDRLAPQFEQQSGAKVTIIHGSSAGGAADSIPERLKRGECADLVILSREGLALLTRQGLVRPGSDTDLVRSTIGMAVREGAAIPDISTPERFVAAMRAAPSIGYSASASGTYLSTDLWPRLGLAETLLPRSRRILSERVGTVVARGEVAIGFQQMSELLPIKGIVVVGPIPEEYQRVTIFTIVETANGKSSATARALVRFLKSPDVSAQIAATGLEPIRD